MTPPRVNTYGDLAGKLTTDYGLVPDPWQQLVLNDWLGEGPDKRWSSLTCGLSVPRQNGKNGILEIREIFGAVGLGEKILHTAHQVKTAQKHFRRLKYFFGRKANDPGANFPELNALVESVRNVNGQEAIYLHNGGSIEIVARSTSSGRGFTVDVIVCDEAQSMSDDDLEALLSTSSAAPLGNPQWIYTGTPPGPRVNGEVFTRVRDDSKGTAYRLSWHEWSPRKGYDRDSKQTWVDMNPGCHSGRIQLEVVEGERARYSDEGFDRERLGVWPDVASGTGVIPAPSWQQQLDEHSVASTRPSLGVEVGPDLAWASIALAGQRPDGDWHLELAGDQNTRGAGVEWLVPTLEDLVVKNPQIRAVVADVAGPISALLEQRGKRWFLKGTSPGVRIEVEPIRVNDLGTSCSLVLSGTVTGWLWHIGQPQLSSAALAAGKRALGDTGMWVWHRRGAEQDITQIQAGTLALHGARADRVVRPLKHRAPTDSSIRNPTPGPVPSRRRNSGSGRRVVVHG